MPGKIKCNFCGDEIIRHRYCISLGIERQDKPPAGKWIKSNGCYHENLCPTCFYNVQNEVLELITKLRNAKGKKEE